MLLRGLTNVSFWADDVAAARDWYTDVLGLEPYFQNPVGGPPAYVEYRLGEREDELGIIDRRYAPPEASREPGARSSIGRSRMLRRPSPGCWTWGRANTKRSSSAAQPGSLRPQSSTRSVTSSASCTARTS
jgi:catechol 2,3-dioxygenase-like lactoylglutathione lyase family enzyme